MVRSGFRYKAASPIALQTTRYEMANGRPGPCRSCGISVRIVARTTTQKYHCEIITKSVNAGTTLGLMNCVYAKGLYDKKQYAATATKKTAWTSRTKATTPLR